MNFEKLQITGDPFNTISGIVFKQTCETFLHSLLSSPFSITRSFSLFLYLSLSLPFSASLYPSLSSLFSIPLFPRGIFFAQRPYETAFFCSSAQLFAALVRFHSLPHWFGPPLFRVSSVPPSSALVRTSTLFRVGSAPLSFALVLPPLSFAFLRNSVIFPFDV